MFDYMPKHSKHSKFQIHSKYPSIHYYHQLTNDLVTVSSIRFEKKGMELPLQNTDHMFRTYLGFHECCFENFCFPAVRVTYKYLVRRNQEIHVAVRTVTDYVFGLKEMFIQFLDDTRVPGDWVVFG
jgi:hypothetical protein